MIEELSGSNSSEIRDRMDFLEAVRIRDDLYRELPRQLETPTALAEFLREEFLRSGRYLSYVRDHRGTLYALAYINNLEVHIWTGDEFGRLAETFTVPAHTSDAPARIIHLHHTNYGRSLNHFNRLRIATPTSAELAHTEVHDDRDRRDASGDHEEDGVVD